MKTFFFGRDSSCCTGPDRCLAGRSPQLEGTAKNPGFFVSGGQVFISTFSGFFFDKSLSRRLVSGCEEPRTSHQKTALHDSRSLQHLLRPRVKAGLGMVRRWTRSGELSSGSQHCAGVAGGDVVTRAGAVCASSARLWRARGACDATVLKREQFACDALLAGRHGEEQRAPVDGGRHAPPRWGRLGRRVKLIVTLVRLLRACLIWHLHFFHMHVCFPFILRWCLKFRVVRAVWVP